MMDEPYAEVPDLGLNRLLVVVTGSAYAWSTPYWLELLRQHCPGLEVRVVLTRSAERFVTRQAVSARVDGAVFADTWPEDEAAALHVEWAEWAEAILVYPATLHFMARLALGLADGPALLAAQCTRAPVAVAPALPPGALEGAAVRQHWAALAARPNVVLVPPVAGRSLTTGREDAWVPPPLPEALRLIVEHRAGEAAGTPGDPGPEHLSSEHLTFEHPPAGTEFGTGLLRTSVQELPTGGRRWRRVPGPLAPNPFQAAGGEVYRLLGAIGDFGKSRITLGDADGAVRLYDVRGEVTAARLLLRREPGAELAEPLHDMGRLLRAVHDLEPPAGPGTGPSRGLTRLGDWLAGRAADPRAACVQGQVRRSLGEARWAQVLAWHHRTVTDSGTTLAHGAAGLGSLVVDRDSGGVDLLIGEDVCMAPWYVDLGWVVGELVELQWQVGGDKGAWQSLTDALFEGYGRDLGPEWKEIAALRILLHVHDIAAYLDDFDHGFDHYCDFLRFLIDL
ncbi:flavoprotein [Streptomyces halobius]|uniref:Phosphotransferase n=1 Tax=Streptomyces halobius TaxID=2879846 RepID=A0ABY4MAI9_9ACTN|nr:flavoprotein [Streptomyces halobius]UQA94428.1 phosphotransferase [Streptomyces halobius]